MRKRYMIPIDEHVYEKVTGTIQNTLTKKEKDRKSMCNTTSDAAVALIVAKRSGELNTKMYV